MNTSANHILLTGKAYKSAFLFALAVLLLVVSCPLKRLLQKNEGSYSSTSVRSNQTNIDQRTNTGYSSADNCCVVKKKTSFAKSGLSQKVVVFTPSYLSNVSDASGFDINYYLSGVNYKAAHVAFSNPSSIPLFLQHLRLLI